MKLKNLKILFPIGINDPTSFATECRHGEEDSGSWKMLEKELWKIQSGKWIKEDRREILFLEL